MFWCYKHLLFAWPHLLFPVRSWLKKNRLTLTLCCDMQSASQPLLLMHFAGWLIQSLSSSEWDRGQISPEECIIFLYTTFWARCVAPKKERCLFSMLPPLSIWQSNAMESTFIPFKMEIYLISRVLLATITTVHGTDNFLWSLGNICTMCS